MSVQCVCVKAAAAAAAGRASECHIAALNADGHCSSGLGHSLLLLERPHLLFQPIHLLLGTLTHRERERERDAEIHTHTLIYTMER